MVCGVVAGTRAILDSRQKALKLTANALYGFTGAMASPLQSVPLADGCLALGSQVTPPRPPHRPFPLQGVPLADDCVALRSPLPPFASASPRAHPPNPHAHTPSCTPLLCCTAELAQSHAWSRNLCSDSSGRHVYNSFHVVFWEDFSFLEEPIYC